MQVFSRKTTPVVHEKGMAWETSNKNVTHPSGTKGLQASPSEVFAHIPS